MKILIVDDSAAMRMMMMRTIRMAGFDGHDFVQASDGKEALDVIHQNLPDLVLTDWNMPNMTGLELMQTLGAEGVNVKIGFVTTEATQDMRDKANEAGADFMISKPFTADSFADALAPVLG